MFLLLCPDLWMSSPAVILLLSTLVGQLLCFLLLLSTFVD